ncbi:MAG: hypothetical protein AAF085_10495 [Planctomycetota bacterium]
MTSPSEMHLPGDLINFLSSGLKFDVDESRCEAGAVQLVSLSHLHLQRYPVETSGLKVFEKDPNYPSVNSYLVLGVNLTSASSIEHEGGADGILLWLPIERRFGSWDASHCTMSVFGPEVTWSRIVENPTAHINAGWQGLDPESPPMTDLIPWLNHPYHTEQVYTPLPV